MKDFEPAPPPETPLDWLTESPEIQYYLNK